MRLVVILALVFLSGVAFGEFESYVIDSAVGGEESSTVELIDKVASRSLGGSITSVLEEAGIYLQNRGIFDVQNDLTIRGTRFSQNSVALNGIVLNDIQSGHLSLSLPLTIYDIGFVGIQKSGNATLYGSDTIGGVVDYNIFDLIEENVKFKLYSGDYGLFGGVASISKGFGVVGVRFSFDRKLSSGYKFNTEFDSWTVNSTIISKLYGFDTVIFVGHLEKSYGASKFYGTEAKEKEIVNLITLNLKYETFKVDGFYKSSIDNYVVNILLPSSQVNNHIKSSLGIGVQNVFRFGDFGDLFLRGEIRWNAIDSTANVGGSITNLLGNRYDLPFAVVGEYGVKPLEGLFLAVGLRTDVWSVGDRKYDPILSPSLKGYYYILPSLKFSGNVNRFFRVPTYVELYYYDGVAFGNTNLSPEEGWNYEVNLNYYFDETKKTFLYLSGFWRDSINVIDFADDRNIPGLLFQATNIRWISGGGVELGFNFDTSSLVGDEGNFKLFYAYSKFDSGVPQNFTFRYDKYLEHQANLSLLQKFRGFEGYLLISFRNRFEGKDSKGNLLPYTSYTLINGRISYEVVTGGRIFVEGYNLGNVKYEDINRVEMPGRWIWAGIEFNLM
ncbi:MAG: TonB-dependent receptor [Spirochaetia bacterium]|nr:TonB-dependent receptor [Spirochaetota bacterium]MCX8096473.1 TonB-dependent receptor [Spirochaetota bacterium]MDW8113149.1 TonB-dependent receptor [Spirochaetia bacterium]